MLVNLINPIKKGDTAPKYHSKDLEKSGFDMSFCELCETDVCCEKSVLGYILFLTEISVP